MLKQRAELSRPLGALTLVLSLPWSQAQAEEGSGLQAQAVLPRGKLSLIQITCPSLCLSSSWEVGMHRSFPDQPLEAQ